MNELADYLQKENEIMMDWLKKMSEETKDIRNNQMTKIDRLIEN